MGVALFVCGCFASMYLGAYTAKVTGTSAEVSGYITGLFSMAIVAKVFDIITNFDAKQASTDLWEGVLRLLRLKN